jgi:hypothetical protein
MDEAFESTEGFSTKIWGNPMWFVLHMITLNFPVKPSKEEKLHYRAFFQSLGWVLPCRLCRENYRKQNAKIPLAHFRSRHTLARYIYKVHNEIPKQPPLSFSFDEMRNTYERFRAKCTKDGCLIPTNSVASRTILEIVPYDENKSAGPLQIMSSRIARPTKKRKPYIEH